MAERKHSRRKPKTTRPRHFSYAVEYADGELDFVCLYAPARIGDLLYVGEGNGERPCRVIRSTGEIILH